MVRPHPNPRPIPHVAPTLITPRPHISPEAAAALADISPPESRHLLESLAELHLLEPTPTNRYKFHDLLRAYATEQAHIQESPEDRDAAIDRLLGWYLHAGHSTQPGLLFWPPVGTTPPPHHALNVATPAQAREWRRVELINLIALARLAAEIGRDAFAWQLLLTTSLDYNLPFDEAIGVLQTGLSAARRLGNRSAESWMLITLGEFQAERGRQCAESMELLQLALAISRKDGQRQAETFALNGIGFALCGLDRAAEAIGFHQQALARWREDGNEWACGIALWNLAGDYQNLGQFDQAMQHFLRADAIFTAAGDQFRLAGAWEGRAAIAVELGQYADAADLYEQAFTINRELGSRFYEVKDLIGLGVAWHRSGDVSQARRYWDEALAICKEFNLPYEDEIRAHLDQLD